MKKTLIELLGAIAAIILFFSVRFNLDDDGTVQYKALLYEYSKVKQ